MNIDAFLDELEKIGAQKCRQGTAPIRVHNLLKFETIDKSGRKKEAGETSAVGKAAKGAVAKHWGKAALVAGGIGTWEAGKQALNDYRMGRAYRKQMNQ